MKVTCVFETIDVSSYLKAKKSKTILWTYCLKDQCTVPWIPNALYPTCSEGDQMSIGEACAFFCDCDYVFSNQNVRVVECTEIGVTVDVTTLCRGKTLLLRDVWKLTGVILHKGLILPFIIP